MATCRVTYQGYRVESCSWQRSLGLSPEKGTVKILTQDLKSFKLEAQAIPWRMDRDVEGLMSIEVWHQQYGKSTITADQLPTGKVPKAGLLAFGDLIFESQINSAQRTVYSNIYVADSGTEEVTRGLANSRAHRDGFVVIPITDVRALYPKFGAVYGDLNHKLRTGRWRPRTVQKAKGGGGPDGTVNTVSSDRLEKADGKPWTVSLILAWLFSQLPGSPSVSYSTLAAKKLKEIDEDPPGDLSFRGDPAVDCIQMVLDKVGFVPGLLPNSNWHLSDRNEPGGGPGVVSVQPGKFGAVADMKYERKSVTVNNRPALVAVMGKPRVQRSTFSYIPIYQDTDGRYYRLVDLPLRWGYSLDRLNQQVCNEDGKRFIDVPPSPFVGGGGFVPGARGKASVRGENAASLHWRRRDILKKWAYRGYAPEHLFADRKPGQGITDIDIEESPFTPVMDPPYYRSELERFSLDLPEDPKEGDKEPYFLVPPVVWAHRVGEGICRNIQEAQGYFTALTASTKKSVQLWGQAVELTEAKLKAIEKMYEVAEDVAKDALQGEVKIQLALDYGIAKSVGEAKRLSLDKKALQAELYATAVTLQKKYEEDRKRFLEEARQAEGKLLEWEKEFLKFEFQHKRAGGFPLKMNLGYGVVEQGAYSIDPLTGIVLFSDLACHVDHAFGFSNEGATVVQDGGVAVTYAYELKTNSVLDVTMPIFGVGGTPQKPEVVFVGFSRETAIKAHVEHAHNMRLYQTDLGYPMNLKKVVQEARGHAEGQLKQPLTQVGYHYECNGVQPAVLDAGTSSVQYEYEENVLLTHVFVNQAESRFGVGPAKAADRERPGVRIIDTRAQEDARFN